MGKKVAGKGRAVFCFMLNWHCASFGVALLMATGGLSHITSGGVPVWMGLVLLLSNGGLDHRHVVSPAWGGGALLITTHITGDCDGSR